MKQPKISTQTEPQPTDRQKKRYDVSLDTRKFEIDLFWKRALFFWGFIASAFVGYAVYSKDRPDCVAISLMLALFGLVCSFSWTLANRGSKYWQENWEAQVDHDEDAITGPLFKTPAKRQDKGWFGAQEFSVSKLAVALSDYVTIVWIILVIRSLQDLPIMKKLSEADCWVFHIPGDIFAILFMLFTVGWLVFVFRRCKTTQRDQVGGGA